MMSIREAIAKAKQENFWTNVPTTVIVWFYNTSDERDDVTTFDLFGEDNENELIDLWEDQYEEFGTAENAVYSVEPLGYIED